MGQEKHMSNVGWKKLFNVYVDLCKLMMILECGHVSPTYELSLNVTDCAIFFYIILLSKKTTTSVK